MNHYLDDELSHWQKVKDNLEKNASGRPLTKDDHENLGFARGFVSGVNKATKRFAESQSARYFTSTLPLYSLVQAPTKEEAARLVDEFFVGVETEEGFIKTITPRPEDFIEVSTIHAAVKYALTTDEDGLTDEFDDILHDLIDTKPRVLIAEYQEAD